MSVLLLLPLILRSPLQPPSSIASRISSRLSLFRPLFPTSQMFPRSAVTSPSLSHNNCFSEHKSISQFVSLKDRAYEWSCNSETVAGDIMYGWKAAEEVGLWLCTNSRAGWAPCCHVKQRCCLLLLQIQTLLSPSHIPRLVFTFLFLLSSDDVLCVLGHFGLVVGKSEDQMGEWKLGILRLGNTLAMKI